MYQTRRYRPYAERVIHSTVPPLTAEALGTQSEAVRTWLASVQSMEDADDYVFYNIMSGTFTSLAAVRNEDGLLMSVMPVQPAPPPKNKP